MREEASIVEKSGYRILKPLSPPLKNLQLRLSVWLAESRFGPFLFNYAVSGSVPGFFEALRGEEYPEDPPSSYLLESWGPAAEEVVVDSLDAHTRLEAALRSLHMAGSSKCSTASNVRPTVLDYHYAFEHGMITPSQAADRLVTFLNTHNAKQHWLSAWSADDIRQQAAASTERYAAGQSLSVFDGVPFVVKDSIDALPYPTTYGTKFMGDRVAAKADAPAVAVLRELGAILLGKSALNEFGAGTHGFNTHAGSAVNPHDPTKMTGGSSSGSAAAVAAGLCPIAIGTDGGGSIRIPSSFCGVVGLKPTKGRLADDLGRHGSYSSVVVSGPIANSVPDALLLYSVMANIDIPAVPKAADQSLTSLPGAAAAAAAAAAQPPRPLGLPKLLVPLPAETDDYQQVGPVSDLKPLQGLKFGVYSAWCDDSVMGVREVMKQTIARLVALGATQVDITLPELDLAQIGHLVVFGREVVADAERSGWLNDWGLRGQLNLDTRMFYANTSNFSDADYVQAQKMKARVLAHFKRAFEQCDIILTPATPETAGPLPPEVATSGVYDLAAMTEAMRYVQVPSLTGLPALAMPGGRKMGIALPVGVQFIGKPWCESTLLRTAAALEQQMLDDGVPHPLPSLLINPIECGKGAHPKARQMTQKLWAKRYGKS